MGIRTAINLLLLSVIIPAAWAGPPFVTDDPEPVELGHWEVYLSSVYQHTETGQIGTLPHVEVNYGAAPNLQLHIIAPYAFNRPTAQGTAYGLGDSEFGLKYRFVEETASRPMIGVFPLIEIPTGSASRGLGSGHLQSFLPIWIQKSSGPWTTYGGGGYFINPGVGNRDYWLFGWEVQKDINRHLTLGLEVFGTTPVAEGTPDRLNLNVGGYYNIDDGHHILFSAGRGIRGDMKFISYLGYQWTYGMKDRDAHARSPVDGGLPCQNIR